ncbi:MAG TPA: M20 family metallo-hydrolase [Bacteroidia bacterium]|jgi:acetylornithine deacetylase|nr:M20 family metallo-hydrolase [Bacteroidia bacterium]
MEPVSVHNKEVHDVLKADALNLLQKLISTSSLSREEDQTAHLIEQFLKARGIETHRKKNNVWAFNKHYKAGLPGILLNSHHDTVKANTSYTRDPLHAEIKDGKLYGLGSNDAGGALVSLIATFVHFWEKPNLPYNLILAASAEEEISGHEGIALIYPELGSIDFALVGEPTLMQLAIAEKGLLVLDCTAHGISGHAAREEGDNALYKAVDAIQWFRTYTFPKLSPWLGAVKMSVTQIQAGTQHNVVPDICRFTVDVRLTEMYTPEEVLEIIAKHVSCDVKPRSMRMKPSSIPAEHPIVKAGINLGRKTYGSPTTSDQALIPAPSLKIGPGDSARSHTADEFIYVSEIEEGIDLYIAMLSTILNHKS